MKEIKLHSGAILSVHAAPFSESKSLYQSVLEEFKSIELNGRTDMAELFKNIVCTGFSSKKIESCLDACFKRCLYNGIKIDKDTFEPFENREDYTQVVIEVVKENIMPFTKGLFAEYHQLTSIIPGVQT